MADEEKKAPELRFKGFLDDWEQRKFKNFIFKAGKKNTKGEDFPAFSVSNKLGLVNQSEQFDGSRLDNLDKTAYKLVNPGEFAYNPARINVGSIALNNLEETVIVSSLYVVLKMDDRLDNEFILQFIKSNNFINEVIKNTEGSVREYLFFENFKNVRFPYVSNIEEQIKIGVLFKQLDNTINLHQRKLTLLKCLKQMYLQKLFPQNGENIPALRFAGFTEIWDQRKLKDLYERNSEKNNGQFDSENTISIASMKFKPEGNGAAEESINSYKVLRMGDIAFEGHTSKLYSFGRFVLNDIGDGIMSPRFTTLRPKKEMYIPFWKQYIIYEPIMKHLLVKATKLGTMMNELVLEDFFNQFLLVPSDNEQQKIGSFFKQLDDIIDLHQCKLEILTELKQVLLAKMIV